MPPRRSLSDRVTGSFRILTELDISHAYERQAGTLALLALAVVAIGVVLVSRLTREPARVTVPFEFPSSGGLAAGDPVLLKGVRVGRVESVRLLGPGRVQVTTSIDPQYAPRRDAKAEVFALDLVGKQAVAYEPGTAGQELPAGVAVVGAEPATLTQQLGALREQAGEIAVRLRGFDPAGFQEELERTRRALARAQRAANAIPADSLATAVHALLGEGRSVVSRLDTLRAAFPAATLAAQRDSLAASAAVLMEQVSEVQGSLGRVRTRMDEGEGNIGRFRQDSTLRVELDAVRTSLRLLQEKLLGRRPPPTP